MSHLNNMLEQVKKLKNGIGAQNLLDAAYKILGNPIAMFNTEYSLQAYTEVITDDPLWNELITYGTFGKESERLFQSEGFIEETANLKIALLKSKKLKYDRINGKVFNKNNTHVANLIIVACDRPFEEGDIIVFEIICKLMSKEISKDECFQVYEQAHQELLIKNLIDGNYDKKMDISQISILYGSLDADLYTVVVDISQCSAEHSITYYRDLLIKAKPAYKYAVYSKYIVIIVSTDSETLNVNKELKEVIKVFDRHNMYAGISSRFENLFELQKYFLQALKAMNCALECKSSQHIFPCDEDSMDKIKQIDALENGHGIQYFLDKGAKIFGNPLLFHDMELNLLGYTQNVEIVDPIWQELITYGTGSNEMVNLFKTENFVEIMDSTKGGALLTSDKIKYDRISWRIYNSDNIRIGCTSIVNTDKPFSEDELVLFGIFSQKFSKEVSKIEFYNNYGLVYSDTIINRLLSGKIDDYTFYSEDISNLYDNLMDSLYLVVIDTSQCSENINLTYFRNLFDLPDAISRYAVYSDYIIIIISTNDTSPENNAKFNEINKVFEQNNAYAGISNRFEDIYDLQKHYKEALNTLNSGIKAKNKDSKKNIFLFAETDKT